MYPSGHPIYIHYIHPIHVCDTVNHHYMDQILDEL